MPCLTVPSPSHPGTVRICSSHQGTPEASRNRYSSGVSLLTTLFIAPPPIIGLSLSWAFSVVAVPSVVIPLCPLRSDSSIGCSWLQFNVLHPPPHDFRVCLSVSHRQIFHTPPLSASRCKRPARYSFRDALPDSGFLLLSGNSFSSRIITTVLPALPDSEWQHPPMWEHCRSVCTLSAPRQRRAYRLSSVHIPPKSHTCRESGADFSILCCRMVLIALQKNHCLPLRPDSLSWNHPPPGTRRVSAISPVIHHPWPVF